MATIRLVPSTIYNAAGTTYLTISNESDMYTNTDSTTYGTVNNINASTSNRYVYLRGFNFGDIPSNATVTAFTIKYKAKETGLSTSTNYRPRLCNGTTTLTASSSVITTTTQTLSFTDVSLDWDTLNSYGSNLGIRFNIRRNNANTAGSCDIYGAEIEVEYTVPTPRTVTTTLTGSGTINPSGTQTMYDEDEYNLIIEPTNASDEVTATKNGSSITLTKHEGEITESNVLGTYALVSGSFNGSGATYFQGIVGHGYDTSSTTTSNYYSSGSGTIAVFTYDVSFEGIPDNATIKSLYMMVNGHAESTSNSNEYMCAQLISGNAALSNELNFKSIGTSNSTQTVTANVTPTVSQLENLKVQCRLGYYGGAINGITVFLTYEIAGVYYTYTTTIDGNMTIAVTINSSGDTKKIYLKNNNSWVQYSKVYKKINGSWVEQASSTWGSLFDTTANYVKKD